MRVARTALDELLRRALRRGGLTDDEAHACAFEMIESEQHGSPDFGVCMVPHILEWHQRKRGEPIVHDRGPASAFVDGQDTVGPRVAWIAMDLAIQKAREHGIGLVGMVNHTPWLRAGTQPRRAAELGLVGATMSVGVAIAAPHGGTRPVFGTNPMGVAVPASGGPIVLDMACTKGSATILRPAAEPMPEGLAIDRRGEPTTDRKDARKGALLLFGEHRGSGIALMIELLAGAWLGGAKVGKKQPGARGALFMAAAPDLFGTGADLAARAELLAEELLAAGDDVHIPGRGLGLGADEVEVDDESLATLRGLAEAASEPT